MFHFKFTYGLLFIVATITLSSCWSNDYSDNNYDDLIQKKSIDTVATSSSVDTLTSYIADGKKLYKQNCAVCHAISDACFGGPGLRAIVNRLPEPVTENFVAYTLNSNNKALLDSVPYFKKMKKEFSPETQMTVFDSILTRTDILKILEYIKVADRPIAIP